MSVSVRHLDTLSQEALREGDEGLYVAAETVAEEGDFHGRSS